MNKKMQILLTSLILLTGCAGVATNLGINNGQLAQCPDKPNCVSSLSQDKEHYIKPILVTGTTLAVKNDILIMLNQLKRSTIIVTEDNYIRAEFRSKVFRFVDDVEFYFPQTQAKPNIITIHLRSASRIGYSDFNVNRERIELIRSKFNAVASPDNANQ